MKKYIMSLFLAVSLAGIAQTNETYTPTYLIGDYLINPTEKTVSVKQFTSGSDYDENGRMTADWWGHKYVPDNTLVYDSITLVLIGEHVFVEKVIPDKKGKVDKGAFSKYDAHLPYYKTRQAYSAKKEKERQQQIKDIVSKYGVKNWQPVREGHFILVENGEKKSAYFDSPVMKSGRGSRWLYSSLLLVSKEGVFIYNEKEANKVIKLDSVLVRNYDRQVYEDLDMLKFGNLNYQFYVYGNKLFTWNGRSVKENINCEEIKQIRCKSLSSNFASDGDNLIYVGQTSYVYDKDEINLTSARLTVPITRPADLKIINTNRITDGENIYTGSSSGIRVIPISALGLYVKSYTLE